MLKYVPNALTIVRFILIPFIILALASQNFILAFALLTLSGITDILDGYIARKYNFITNFGKLMDPLADKCTQISILATLVIKNIVPFWILVVVILKEFAMISGASFLYGKEYVVSSKWYGKLATVLFYIAMVCSLLIEQFQSYIPENKAYLSSIDTPIYYLALVATIFSLFMYTKAYYMQGYLKKENLTLDSKENNNH